MKYYGLCALTLILGLSLVEQTNSYFSFTTLPPTHSQPDAESMAKAQEKRKLMQQRKDSLGKIMGKALMSVLAEKHIREALSKTKTEKKDGEVNLGEKSDVVGKVVEESGSLSRGDGEKLMSVQGAEVKASTEPERELRDRREMRQVKRSQGHRHRHRRGLFDRRKEAKKRSLEKAKCIHCILNTEIAY